MVRNNLCHTNPNHTLKYTIICFGFSKNIDNEDRKVIRWNIIRSLNHSKVGWNCKFTLLKYLYACVTPIPTLGKYNVSHCPYVLIFAWILNIILNTNIASYTRWARVAITFFTSFSYVSNFTSQTIPSLILTGVVHAVTGTFGAIITKVSLNTTWTGRKQTVSTILKYVLFNLLQYSYIILEYGSVLIETFDFYFIYHSSYLKEWYF